MIFVCLGTQDKNFKRLLKEIDKLIENKVIDEKVVVQAGYTKYKSKNMDVHDYFNMDEFNENIKKSSFIIVHGGVGSILDGLKNNKKVIAIPRLEKYDEHENDHQLQIINNFVESGYILGGKSVEDLESLITKIPVFKPNKYNSNNEYFVSIIENFIEEIL